MWLAGLGARSPAASLNISPWGRQSPMQVATRVTTLVGLCALSSCLSRLETKWKAPGAVCKPAAAHAAVWQVNTAPVPGRAGGTFCLAQPGVRDGGWSGGGDASPLTDGGRTGRRVIPLRLCRFANERPERFRVLWSWCLPRPSRLSQSGHRAGCPMHGEYIRR
jgi:hypothetical protein